MIDLITDNLTELTRLCREFGVRKLEVFGSAATGEFNPETSDIDFLVEFEDYGPGIFDRYFEFLFGAEELFGRSVDLVFDSGMKNPYLREAVDETRKPIYESTRGEVAA